MDLFHRLLEYYSISEDEFTKINEDINPQLFVNTYLFDNVKEAVNLAKNAIAEHKKTIIYGDYDADGIMGASILTKMFEYLDYNVSYYIPNRYKDGYGINLAQARRIVEEKYKFVICVDNGISALEPIEFLRENGVDVLVIDHHEIPDTLPIANTIIHPFYSNLGGISTSGASTAFFFSIYMLKRFDKYLSTLASISIISDMMPLKGYNRDLLRIAFSRYENGEFKCIDLLKGDDLFDENSIGMSIAPKINSIGRMIEDSSINQIVDFFVTQNNDTLLTYFNWINLINENRKASSKAVSESSFSDVEGSSSIVEIVDEKEGLIGLIANSLMNKYKKPTIIFTYNEEQDLLKGSCRSLDGFDVVECFDNLKDIMLNYGGHSLAGGCSIKKDKFTEFKKRFNDFATAHPVCFVDKENIPISITELTFENYELVKKFSPFGEEWKKPLFLLKNIRTESLKYSKDGKHLITQIGTNSKITGFNISTSLLNISSSVNFVGSLRLSWYKGNKNLEFLISDIKY